MPHYVYRCSICGNEVTVEWTIAFHDRVGTKTTCTDPNCQGLARQVFGVNIKRSMQEHFNPSIGQPVSSMAQFRSELDRAGDEYSARVGFDNTFQVVEPGERAQGVTDEGMHETAARRRELGMDTATKKIIV